MSAGFSKERRRCLKLRESKENKKADS